MSDRLDAFATVLVCLKRMEATLLGMKQMREYIGKGMGREMLDSLIEEADSQTTEIKRKLIQ